MAGSLQTRLGRLSAQFLPRGKIVVIDQHSCQSDEELIGKAAQALGHSLEPGDLVVLIEITAPCPQGDHQHDDEIMVHARVD
jgi:hypothetical protein